MQQSICPFPSSAIVRMVGVGVPIMRVQDPTILQTKGDDPKWFIKPYVDYIDKNGNLDRKQQRIYLGRCSEIGKRDAVTKKTEVMGKINKSQFMTQSQVKFGEFLNTFEKTYIEDVGLAEQTQLAYGYQLRKYIRPAFGEMMFGEIDTLSIDTLFKKMAKESKGGGGYGLRKCVKTLLNIIFNQARRWGVYKGENPVKESRLGKDKKIRQFQQLGLERINRLLNAMPVELRRICEMELYCTLSISEVMGIQWKHIDFVDETVIVEQAKGLRGQVSVTKVESRRRMVPLGELAKDLAAIYPGGQCANDFVFYTLDTSGEKMWTVEYARKLLVKVAKDQGIYFQGFGFHQFRREAITQYGESMGGLQTQRMAGHSRLSMTFKYTMKDIDKQEKAVRELQGKVRGKVIEFKKEIA